MTKFERIKIGNNSAIFRHLQAGWAISESKEIGVDRRELAEQFVQSQFFYALFLCQDDQHHEALAYFKQAEDAMPFLENYEYKKIFYEKYAASLVICSKEISFDVTGMEDFISSVKEKVAFVANVDELLVILREIDAKKEDSINDKITKMLALCDRESSFEKWGLYARAYHHLLVYADKKARLDSVLFGNQNASVSVAALGFAKKYENATYDLYSAIKVFFPYKAKKIRCVMFIGLAGFHSNQKECEEALRYSSAALEFESLCRKADQMLIIQMHFESAKLRMEICVDATDDVFSREEPLIRNHIEKLREYGFDIDKINELGSDWMRLLAGRGLTVAALLSGQGMFSQTQAPLPDSSPIRRPRN